MSIRKWKDGKWQIDWYQNGQRRRRIVEGTLSYAEEVEREIRRSVKPHKTTNPRLDELYPDFLAWYKLHRKETSVRALRLAWGELQPYFGVLPINCISAARIQQFQTDYRDRPPYANRCMLMLSGMVKWAYKNKYSEVPKLEYDPLRYEKPIPVIPSHEDVNKFLEQVTDRDKKIACMIMAYSGTRYTETIKIRWNDVSLEQGTAILRQTKSRQRMIVLHEKVVDLLREEKDKTGYVLPQWKSMKTLFKAASRRAGIKPITPHKLRHYFATRLVAKSGNLRLAQVALGHADISTTTIYTHIDIEQIRAAID